MFLEVLNMGNVGKCPKSLSSHDYTLLLLGIANQEV